MTDTSHSAGPAVPPAAEPTMPEGVWRCFHCDEVFTDVDAASEHFGANEFHDATCVLMQKGAEFLAATIRDLEARNRELLHRAVEAETDAEGYVGLRAELERYFGSSSAWICWNRMDEKQGRIEALEEQCAALRADHERTLAALREARRDVLHRVRLHLDPLGRANPARELVNGQRMFVHPQGEWFKVRDVYEAIAFMRDQYERESADAVR